ncbi:neurofilament heavy polypeptide-like [Lytechinus pictus]|uniref:neurofilament heavy polypeptide-like n=1 Tax=Lytechinus pictus TaxID=7653 RepID=UPI0030B9D1F6
MEGSTIESPRLVEAPISASMNQSEESAPPSLIRSSDTPEESMQVEGGTSSVKSRFESGDFQNSTPASIATKSINIYDAPAEKGVAENTPVRKEDIFHADEAQEEVKTSSDGIGKFKSMFEVGGVTNLEAKTSRDPVNVGSLAEYENTTEGHVAESTPVIRDDVIRSSDTSEDPGIKRGLSKSLRNRFETERISNIEEKPREKIEISRPEERRVYQPPQKPKREDVVNAESTAEDPGIKSGQARSLRSLFEKGNVSNVPEKPRAALDRSPRSLEDYKIEDQVSESTPTRKEDVVSSSTTLDEPMKSAESTRSLKKRWETGQVERVPEKPKPSLERTPQSLDSYSMTMVISENTPEERTDIVKSSASSDDYLTSKGGSASSLKAKWESGEVHNADVTTEKAESKPKRFSAYYDGDEQTNGVVEHENGIMEEREEEQEEEEEDSSVDASWEIKAARAAAMADIEDE